MTRLADLFGTLDRLECRARQAIAEAEFAEGDPTWPHAVLSDLSGLLADFARDMKGDLAPRIREEERRGIAEAVYRRNRGGDC